MKVPVFISVLCAVRYLEFQCATLYVWNPLSHFQMLYGIRKWDLYVANDEHLLKYKNAFDSNANHPRKSISP